MKKTTVFQAMALGVAVLGVSAAIADTATWTGGAGDNDFCNPENWETKQVPGSGDVAVFNTSVELKSSQTMGFPDCGTDGLAVSVAAGQTVYFNRRIMGSGPFIKRGPGELQFRARNYEHTGGLKVEDGVFVLNLDGSDGIGASLQGKSSEVFGPGEIVVTGTGVFRANAYSNQTVVDSPIRVTNHTGESALQSRSRGLAIWNAKIQAECDFTFLLWTGDLKVGGELTGQGHTVTFGAGPYASYGWGQKFVFPIKVVDANVHLNFGGGADIYLQGASLNPKSLLTVGPKKCRAVMDASAVWGGRMLVDAQYNETSAVIMTAAGNVIPTTIVEVRDGGVFHSRTNAGFTLRSFTHNGTVETSGTWDKTIADSSITGDSTLTIDDSCTVWIGDAAGAWSEKDNWDFGVPRTGGTAVIAENVTFESETVDIGGNGLTVDCRGDVEGSLILAGSGRFVKTGAGKWTTGGKYQLTGGVRIASGQVYETMSGTGFNGMTDALGTGTIEITGSGSLLLSCYESTNTQAIVVRDHDGSVAPIQASGSLVNLGTITGDADFTIRGDWGKPRFLGKIATAPGKTVTFTVPDWNSDGYKDDTEFADVDANLKIVSKNGKPIRLTGATVRPANALTVANGKMLVPVSQRWGDLTLAKGSSVEVDASVVLRCESLTVDQEVKAFGNYRRAKLPGYLSGLGRILVGNPLGVLFCIR